MKRLFERCLGAEYIHTDNGGDYAIQTEGDTLYLLFEWSDGVEDWLNNFDFPAQAYRHTAQEWYCHRGFLKVWKSIRDELEVKVSEILEDSPEIKKITCVGYSHGGALSVLATENFEYLYGSEYLVTGYGFGAPRVLYGYVPHEVRERLKRFVTIRNGPDLVTHLPPLLMGYHNSGDLLRIGRKQKYTPIKAHYPEAYITELNRLEGIECPIQ